MVRSTSGPTPSRSRPSRCAPRWQPPRSATTSSTGTPRCGSSRSGSRGCSAPPTALWTPTGSMGNLIALMSHLRRGDAFLAPAGAHVLDAELGTAAWLAGGMPRPMEHDAGPGQGLPDGGAPTPPVARALLLAAHDAAVRWRTPTTPQAAPSPHPRSTPPSRPPRGRAKLRVHLDGARLWHAAVALGVPARRVDRRRRHRPGLPQQGPRRPARLGRRGLGGVRRAGPPAAQDARRRRPAGRGRWPRPGSSRSIASTGSPRTTSGPPRSLRDCASAAGGRPPRRPTSS